MTRRRKLLIGGAALVLVVGGYLAVEYFEFQTLFIDDKVNEARPAPVAATGDDAGGDGAGVDTTTADPGPLATGSFVGRSHPTRGEALVLAAEGGRVLRLEDFETDNGPDLNVYLSAAPPDADAGQFDDDYVDLGDLKGNIGAQNYEIPEEVDLDRYHTVVVWCVRFSVAFGTAELA